MRKLARQLNQMAPTADEHVLRAILGKREALMVSIRSLLAQSDTGREAIEPDGGAYAERKRSLREMVSEIARIDSESSRILAARSDEVAAEIRKMRAGKQWRENARSWK